mgnify:CR=1 FL=1|jgi:hypothetical protein
MTKLERLDKLCTRLLDLPPSGELLSELCRQEDISEIELDNLFYASFGISVYDALKSKGKILIF